MINNSWFNRYNYDSNNDGIYIYIYIYIIYIYIYIYIYRQIEYRTHNVKSGYKQFKLVVALDMVLS